MEETEFLKFEIVEEELDQRENCKPPKVINKFLFIFAKRVKTAELIEIIFV